MPIRPPQQARALKTRRRLLDAATATLCEAGSAGTTTTAVAQRAGVSQGALYKHFGSKQGLIAATTEHLFGRLIQDFEWRFPPTETLEERLDRTLRELWRIFQRPELYAVMELYIAARTDEALRAALAPVLLRHRVNLLKAARALFPEAARQNPDFPLAVEGILAAMQGAALSAAVVPELSGTIDVMPFLQRLCRRELLPKREVNS